MFFADIVEHLSPEDRLEYNEIQDHLFAEIILSKYRFIVWINYAYRVVYIRTAKPSPSWCPIESR